MEFVKKIDLLNISFLESTRSLRYEKAVAVEEKNASTFKDHKARDVYSMGVLIEEVLNESKGLESRPGWTGFASLCPDGNEGGRPVRETEFRSSSTSSIFRPNLPQGRGFFIQFGVQNEGRKGRVFPRKSRGTLFDLPEKVVASQLTSLLLSRNSFARTRGRPRTAAQSSLSSGQQAKKLRSSRSKQRPLRRVFQRVCGAAADENIWRARHSNPDDFTAIFPPLLQGISSIDVAVGHFTTGSAGHS